MEAFSIVAALATAVQAAALIMLHLLPTGYNPVRGAVSDLARISGSGSPDLQSQPAVTLRSAHRPTEGDPECLP